METIKIAHLYYDLLNLYGESANILSLKKHFEKNKIKVITHFLSIDDEIDFNRYDIFYLGSGNLETFLIVYADIIKRKKEIKKVFKDKLFIATGNSQIYFGKTFRTLDGKVLPMLDLLDFDSVETDFQIVGESIGKSDKTEPIIGFQNRFSVLKNINEPRFITMEVGTGSTIKDLEEGIFLPYYLGTYMLGPLFIRNPLFTEYIVKQELEKRNIEYIGFHEELATKAYQNYLDNFEK